MEPFYSDPSSKFKPRNNFRRDVCRGGLVELHELQFTPRLTQRLRDPLYERFELRRRVRIEGLHPARVLHHHHLRHHVRGWRGDGRQRERAKQEHPKCNSTEAHESLQRRMSLRIGWYMCKAPSCTNHRVSHGLVIVSSHRRAVLLAELSTNST